MPKTDDNLRLAQLNRLIETGILSAQLEITDLLQTLVEVAAELTESESAAILLEDPTIGALRYTAGPWHSLEQLRTAKISVKEDLYGMIMTQPDGVLFSIPTHGETELNKISELMNIQVTSLAAVPVCRRHKCLGILAAHNKLDNLPFTDQDLSVLHFLAALAASTLEQVRLQEDKQHLLDEMTRLERRKRDFVAITSHELRTPLGLILGHATFLRAMLGEPEVSEQINAIIESAMRLKEIIESISKVEHVETGTVRLRSQPYDINLIIKDAVTSFKELTDRKEIALSVNALEGDLTLECDPEKLALVLNNLLRNAVNFTEPGGRIEISAHGIGGYVQVAVTDNGIGIPAADIERIFERFYQVEAHMTRKHGGMGLGLSVAREMVELHNGRIWATSQEGRGSTFIFILPRRQETKAAGEA